MSVTMQKTRPGDLNYLRDPVVAACLVLVLLGAGAFGVWAATAQLAQGITAGGTLVVEDRRRTIQHLEGGIIQALHISEGDKVAAGDVTMVISDATASARLAQARAERVRLVAGLDRLSAQIDGAATLSFPGLDALGPDQAPPAIVRTARDTEARIFADQRAALEGERALLRAGVARLLRERDALDVRRAGKRREIESLRAEEQIQAEALSEGMGNISRVNELARLLAIAETDLLNLDEQESVLDRAIDEAQLELTQLDLRNRAQLSEQQAELAGDLSRITDELTALEDRIARNAVIAPVDGVVIDLAHTATGAIVGPGDAIYQIVPSDASFEVDVRFAPQDRDDLMVGKAVNLRFGTLDPINPPEILGTLERIGADATLDQQTGQFYYGATVAIPPEALETLEGLTLSPGIPVEVFFDKGAPRTPLSYFIEPLAEMFRLGMRS